MSRKQPTLTEAAAAGCRITLEPGAVAEILALRQLGDEAYRLHLHRASLMSSPNLSVERRRRATTARMRRAKDLVRMARGTSDEELVHFCADPHEAEQLAAMVVHAVAATIAGEQATSKGHPVRG
jgi:hypothetical protein